MEFKIGDKVVDTRYGLGEGTVVGLPGYSELYPNDYRVYFDSSDCHGLCVPRELKLFESEESTTTTEQNDAREVNNIIRTIDEYIFYDGNVERGVAAKPGLAISVLLQILVSNGTLTYDQVKRALVNKDSQEGK